MTRAWIGTALLAGSWLFGRDYFAPAQPFLWTLIIFAGAILLVGIPTPLPNRRQGVLTVLLALPAVWLMPFPYKVVPVLICAGVLMQLAPIPRPWPRALGRGVVVAGVILFAQSLALIAYETLTARSHVLPLPLASVIGAVAKLLGIDSAVDGCSIAMRANQDQIRIGATWELLIDPATVCFVVGGLVLLAFVRPNLQNAPDGRRCWCQSVVWLALIAAAWMPFRVAFLLALTLHRNLRADAMAIPNVADVLVNRWIHLGLVVVLACIVMRIVSKPADLLSRLHNDRAVSNARTQKVGFRIAGSLLVAFGSAFIAVLYFWQPIGERKLGRVTVVERHSTWEPTTEPYGTESYGEAGSYNYAAAYAYCGQYYEMSRLLESESINDNALAQCDILVIKTPTARYSEAEVNAVVQFVERGGSLLMVGDHTNVFNMNTYLNDIARHFGFTFRNDLLFRIGDPYKQAFQPSTPTHPILQHVPPMHFAVSCSIDPGYSLGRMVIRNTGLWSLPPAYHESNYHPQAEYASSMHYGAWCQLWSTAHGSGRVVAFADSTLFSNFCVFQPGKAELLRGMLEWLNHTSYFDKRGPKLLSVIPISLVGSLLVFIGCWRDRRADFNWLALPSAALGGWSVAAAAIGAVNFEQFEMPPVLRPIPHVVVDRTLSSVPLHTGAFSDAEEGVGYGMLEQWIPRIGNSTSRETGEDVFAWDGLVIICPTRSVGRAYQDQLVAFVRGGGNVLIIDSADSNGSTTNSLLAPFGMASNHDAEYVEEGELQWSATESVVPLQESCEISGGESLAVWNGRTVAARLQFGRGEVTAIGFGSLFNDENMGTHWLPEPTPEVLERYTMLYSILRLALPHTPSPTD